MAEKYHVNPETGNVARCMAYVGTCPFGGASGEENHYDSMGAAHKGYEDQMNAHLTTSERGFDESVFSGKGPGTYTVDGVTAKIGGLGKILSISNCSSCQRNNGQGPSHSASDRCQSGKRNHCTCNACF